MSAGMNAIVLGPTSYVMHVWYIHYQLRKPEKLYIQLGLGTDWLLFLETCRKTLYGVPNALILFGRQPRKLRQRRDLSQERLAELCGYETNQIGRIERAERTVSFEGIMRISYGLSMPPAELFKLIPAAKRLPRKGQYSGKKKNNPEKGLP